MAAADLLQRVRAAPRAATPDAVGHGQQQVLGREVVVAEARALGVGPLEDVAELAAHAGLAPP